METERRNNECTVCFHQNVKRLLAELSGVTDKLKRSFPVDIAVRVQAYYQTLLDLGLLGEEAQQFEEVDIYHQGVDDNVTIFTVSRDDDWTTREMRLMARVADETAFALADFCAPTLLIGTAAELQCFEQSLAPALAAISLRPTG